MTEVSSYEDNDQPEQIDWCRIQDVLQEANRLLRTRALDLGARFLADKIGQKASTVQNQLTGDDERRPSFDLALAVALCHRGFRKRLIQLLEPAPDLEPLAAIHEIETTLVPRLGEHDAKALRSILVRVRKLG
jgi:hypothetical protein